MGLCILGNLNVHSVRWLTNSGREIIEGRLSRDLSDRLGLRPLVTEPIHGKYLLDLVVTDVLDCTAKPCTAVADHKEVLTHVKFKIPETASHARDVWHFSEAD